MTANLLQSYSIGRLNGERRYLRDNKYTSIGYFCESSIDTCGHDIPISLFNPRVVNNKKVIIDFPLEPTLMTGSIPDLLVRYLDSTMIISYYIGTLNVSDIVREPVSHEIESELYIGDCFGKFPWKFGTYEIFAHKKCRDTLISKIEGKLPSFDVEKNTSKDLLRLLKKERNISISPLEV